MIGKTMEHSLLQVVSIAASLLTPGYMPAAATPGKFARDWTKAPAVVQIDTKEDVYIVGDAHADYERLVNVLQAAGIIPGKPVDPADVRWAGGKSVVVFTGDLIDKGPKNNNRALDIITLVRALGDAASQEGGQVVALMGNHEAEFLATPEAKKVSDFVAELRNAHLDEAQVSACGGDLGEFLCSRPFAARINDWFISHAGNTSGRTLDRLVSDLQSAVDREGFGTKELVGDDSILEARLGDSPWFHTKGSTEQEVLKAAASALGVAHIVEGHQPGKVTFADGKTRKEGQMYERFGLIFLADSGMSHGVGKTRGAVLRIRTDRQQVVAICRNGDKRTLWDAKANPDVGKAACQ